MRRSKQPVKPNTQRLYSDVRRHYEHLSSISEFGKQKHSDEWILAKLAFDFYLSEKTIENIIFNRV